MGSINGDEEKLIERVSKIERIIRPSREYLRFHEENIIEYSNWTIQWQHSDQSFWEGQLEES